MMNTWTLVVSLAAVITLGASVGICAFWAGYKHGCAAGLKLRELAEGHRTEKDPDHAR